MSKVIAKKGARSPGINKKTWKEDLRKNWIVYVMFLLPFTFPVSYTHLTLPTT